jgi:hypothetical protein
VAKVRVRVELDRVQVLGVGVSLAAPYVFETTRQVLNRSQVLTPVRTGKLRASQNMTMRARRTFVAGTVETRVKYAHAVHNGTRRHVIRPTKKQALSFYWAKKGRRVVVRWVQHPGTRARPFMLRALLEEAVPRDFIVTPGTGLGGVGAALAEEF